MAASRGWLCKQKVAAGEYFDYDACYLAEIRTASIEAEAEAKAELASVAPATFYECEDEIQKMIQRDWLWYMSPYKGDVTALRVCRPTP
jgi:hypothetical protein